MADRPGVEIHVREGVHAVVLEDVRSGVADFGIGYVDELPDFAAGTALSRETFRRRAGATQLGRPAGLSLSDLARRSRSSALPTESRTRRTIDAAAAISGVPLRQAVVVSQIAHPDGAGRRRRRHRIVPSGATQGPLARGCAPCRWAEPKLRAGSA